MAKRQQTTVYLEPYHVAGIKAVEEKRKALGKNTGHLQAGLIREGLELLFVREGITDERIKELLNDEG